VFYSKSGSIKVKKIFRLGAALKKPGGGANLLAGLSEISFNLLTAFYLVIRVSLPLAQ